MGKKYFFRLIVLCSFRIKTVELVSLFILRQKNIIFGKLKTRQNNKDIVKLKFESRGFLENGKSLKWLVLNALPNLMISGWSMVNGHTVVSTVLHLSVTFFCSSRHLNM